MATLQTTNVNGTLSVNGTAVGGGKSLKYVEFNSSGTFTPTAAAISAGGIHSVFLVGGGERGASSSEGGAGGEVVETLVTLTGTTGCAVTIGSGGTSNGADGGNSSVAFSSAGGSDVTAVGGKNGGEPDFQTSGAGGKYAVSTPSATISVTTNPLSAPNRNTSSVYYYWYAYAYQSAYANAYQSAYSYATTGGNGYKGYGAGGSGGAGGMNTPAANSGAGSKTGTNAADGYCLITYFES